MSGTLIFSRDGFTKHYVGFTVLLAFYEQSNNELWYFFLHGLGPLMAAVFIPKIVLLPRWCLPCSCDDEAWSEF